MNKALEHRKQVKAKKPTFLRQDAHKRAKFRPASWRKPKGFHSKMRLGHKSYALKVQIGWGSPASVRNLHKSGLASVHVETIAQLDALDMKTQGAIISGTLGAKKREQLLLHAKEKKITILNLKTEETLKKLGEQNAARKKEHAAKLTAKQKKDAEKKKSIEQRVEKETTKEASDDEAKEKAFEEEKQKVLTKRS